MYPQVATSDGEPMNAMSDCVIRMTRDELPPACTFRSLTLYDLDQEFFIPNDRMEYSAGENAGIRLDDEGGIEIHLAAEQPEGVPEENWLPTPTEDLDLSSQFRVYAPDLARMENWTAPVAEKIGGE